MQNLLRKFCIIPKNNLALFLLVEGSDVANGKYHFNTNMDDEQLLVVLHVIKGRILENEQSKTRIN